MLADALPVAAEDARLSDIRLVAQLVAIDPAFVGGTLLRAHAGPIRDRWMADLRALREEGGRWRVLPVHVDDARLLGGIDLAATLRHGKATALPGLLADADGGVLVLSMAERVRASTVAHLVAAMDSGVVHCAREGIETRDAARFGVVALDESIDGDDAVRDALCDRLAFHVDLGGLSLRDIDAWPALPARETIAAARSRLRDVTVDDRIVDALCAAALALGVVSIRASVQAVRAARLIAALAGRAEVSANDASVAARLVLAPRATEWPDMRDQSTDTQPADGDAASADADDAGDPADDAGDAGDAGDADDADPADAGSSVDADAPSERVPSAGEQAAMTDRVIAAAAAAIPAGLLARLVGADASARSSGSVGKVGAARSSHRGRPAGAKQERPRSGARLDVIATLRAAVPWQRLRGRDMAGPIGGVASPLRIRAEDFHVGKFKQRGRTTTIFAVDASGSSALNRLAEAKGAVELLLADCYVRRDSVAVFGFRGRTAELLLPPTRSLVRAKRSLAELPGGGGTPLAAGIDAAGALADAIRRKGDTAVVVILSDGRANVARDGGSGRPRAEADARLAASALRLCGASSIFVDTSTQPHPLARDLAGLMGARYLFLPHAEAATLTAAVRGAAPAAPAMR